MGKERSDRKATVSSTVYDDTWLMLSMSSQNSDIHLKAIIEKLYHSIKVEE